MFTGLVKDIGKIRAISPNTEGKLITIESKALISEIGIDDSVSVNGACQTAVRIEGNCFVVQAVHTTLQKTTLGKLKIGDDVNLELAMRLLDRLGGHIVQGHVNDVGTIISVDNRGNNYVARVQVGIEQMKYIVKEGSITIDGISLTVSDVDKEGRIFTVSIIPHTWQNTVLKNRYNGSLVNIEVDILGKYIESLLGIKQSGPALLSDEWFRSKGY